MDMKVSLLLLPWVLAQSSEQLQGTVATCRPGVSCHKLLLSAETGLSPLVVASAGLEEQS